jgi:deoxyribodipyrimidine photo-lyase
MSSPAEQFLDQMVTWRELGYRAARYLPGNDTYAALPAWARATLEEHAADEREYLYRLDQLDAGETHDELWNAAQRQLREEGTIHNYLRMLWGKKILEWTGHPEEAHDTMFELNNRYALDGRDPNSVSGIHWVLGRYDRPWGPERAVFGTVRYMSSRSARRKLRLDRYQSKMLKT